VQNQGGAGLDGYAISPLNSLAGPTLLGGMSTSPSPKAPLRLVMFDFDGTLADSIPLVVAAFQRMHERLGLPVPTEGEVRGMFGPSEDGILQRHLPDRWEEALLVYLAEYEAAHDAMLPALFEGVPELLAELHEAQVGVALITGKGPGTSAISLARLDLLGEFDYVRMGEPEGCRKQQHIAEVMAEAGVAPNECAYIGDAPGDMRATLACGVVAVGAAWAATANPDELREAGAQHLFTTWNEFCAWLHGAVQS